MKKKFFIRDSMIKQISIKDRKIFQYTAHIYIELYLTYAWNNCYLIKIWTGSFQYTVQYSPPPPTSTNSLI